MTKAPRTEVVEGVWIVSRHGIDAELRKMRRAVEGMPPHLRAEIEEFFCDSKAGQHYLISVHSVDAVRHLNRHVNGMSPSYVAYTVAGEWVDELLS